MWVQIRCFQVFFVQIRYFPHSLGGISILLECFEAKSNNFQMFWIKIRYFSIVLDPGQSYCFQRFGVQIQNFLKFLCTMLRNFSNMPWRDSIIFKCFEPKEDTFQIFWGEFRYISNYF